MNDVVAWKFDMTRSFSMSFTLYCISEYVQIKRFIALRYRFLVLSPSIYKIILYFDYS